jgi:hypothetical protein
MYASELPSGDHDAKRLDCLGSVIRNVLPARFVAQSPNEEFRAKVSKGRLARGVAAAPIEPAAASAASVAAANRSAVMAHKT